MSKLTDALAAWGVIKNETRRNANTHTRIGDAGLAILEVVQEKANLVDGKVPLSELPEMGGSIPETVLSYPNGYVNLGNQNDITKIYGDEIYLYAEEMNYGGVFTSSFINLTGNTFTINHNYDDTNNLGNSGGYSIWANEITLHIANNSFDFEGNCQFNNSITQDFNGMHIASRYYNDFSSINLGYNQNGIYAIDLNAPEVIVNGVLFSDLFNGSSGYVNIAHYAVCDDTTGQPLSTLFDGTGGVVAYSQIANFASYDLHANDLSTLFNGTGGNVYYSQMAKYDITGQALSNLFDGTGGNVGYSQIAQYAKYDNITGQALSNLFDGTGGNVAYSQMAQYDITGQPLSTLFDGTAGNVYCSQYAGAADIANTANTDFNTAYISKINNAFIIDKEEPDLFNIYIEYDVMMKKMSKAEFKTWLNN